MVSTVGTAGRITATEAFNQRKIDRNQDGTLWVARETGLLSGTATALSYSKDGGATWTQADHFDQRHRASLFIDIDDYAHLVWKQNAGADGLSSGYLYYMRGTPNAGRTAWTWSAAVVFGSTTAHNYPDVVACRNPSGGWDAFIVAFTLSGTSANYASYARVPITSGGAIGTPVLDGLSEVFAGAGMGILGGSYAVAAATYPSIDFNHTGDGKTVAGGTPHLYVGWTAGAAGAGKGMRFRKAVYSAGAWTWNAERELSAGAYQRTAQDWFVTIFDGTRVVVAGQLFVNGGATDNLLVWEVDAADTTISSRELIPGGNSGGAALFHGSLAHDTAGNLYLFGRGDGGANGTRLVNRRKWTRSGATLGPIVTLDSTGPDAPYMSARRGTQGAAIDVVWTDGTASPYNVQFDRLSVNRPPGNPGTPTVTPNPVNTLGTIDWAASTDPDGDPVQYWVDLSTDNGASWSRILNNVKTNSATYDFTNVAATSTARVRVLAGQDPDVGAYSAWVESANFTIEHNKAPNAPTNLAPAGNTTLDRTQPQKFRWQFNDPDAGDAQSRFVLEHRPTGGSWTVVDSQTVGGGTLQEHTFAAGTFAAGNYEWRVTTYDQQGVASPTSSSAFFKAANPPAGPTITSPANGSTVTQTGTVAWSYPTQSHYRVRRVADAADGTPDTATVYYDSGEVASTSKRDLALTFATNQRYEHVQVQVRDSGTALLSTYSSVRVLVSYTSPLQPSVVSLPVPESGYQAFTVSDRTPPNLLASDAQASFEDGSTGGWVATAATLSNLSSWGVHGSRSLRLSASTADTAYSARTPLTAATVTAGSAYTGSVSVRPGAARTVQVSLLWADDAGTAVGTAAVGTATAVGAGATARLTVTGTAPAGATRAALRAAVTNTTGVTVGETLDVDAAQVEAGSAATSFVVPSTPAVTTHNVYRRKVGVGSISETRIATGVGSSFRDYSAASGQAYLYRVESVAANGTSTYSADVETTLTLQGLWLHDPADPQATALQLRYDGHGRESVEAVDVVTRPFIGRVLPVPEWTTRETLTVSAETRLRREDAGVRDRLLALLRRRAVLCWRDVRGRKVYGVLGEVPLTDDVFGHAVTLHVTAVDWSEAV